MKNNRRGITLVALVITIIFLLILAGITISQLTGSGLFENARLAKQKSENAQEKEEHILSEYENFIDGAYRNNKNYDSNIYDEWTTWLHSAGIENPENYNETDILSNEEIMNKVMNNEAAVNYMIKSKYFIMPAICASDNATKKIGEKASVMNKVLADDDWENAIMNSDYKENILKGLLPTFTSNSQDGVTVSVSDQYSSNHAYCARDGNSNTVWSTASGNYNPHYYQIVFDKETIIKSYYLLGGYCTGTTIKFYMQASADGENWVNLEGDTVHEGSTSKTLEYNVNIENDTLYRYYRFYYPQGGWTYGSSGASFIEDFQLYGYQINN